MSTVIPGALAGSYSQTKSNRSSTPRNVPGTVVLRDANGAFDGIASTVADNAITSAKIANDTIVNADIKSDAAIAGTKIAPNFGSQNIQTTGTISANHGSSITTSTTGDALTIANSSNSANTTFGMTAWRTGTDTGPDIRLRRAEGGVQNTHTIVDQNDVLGTIRFYGSDGTGFIQAALIRATCNGAPGANSMPGEIMFATTASGDSSPTNRMRIDSAGNVGIGATSISNTRMRIDGNLTGSTTAHGIYIRATAAPDATNTAHGYTTNLLTAANGGSPYTLNSIFHFEASQNTFSADSTVTFQVGYHADSSLTGGTNNYGFYSELAAASGRWNFYAAGTAQNYFAGTVAIGTPSPNAAALLDVSSTTKGFLPPRMTTAQRNAISTPPAGLMVYNTTTNKLNVRTASSWEAVTSS